MKIAVCDDQKHFRKDITDNLIKYHDKFCPEEHWDIVEFDDGTKLIDDDDKKNLYFLDLEMPAMDGINVAEGLRRKWHQDCDIIIMTSHVERLKEGFRVNAFRFMTKPVDYDEMQEGLNTLRRSKVGYDTIILNSFGEDYQIAYRDIRYICKESGDTIIFVKNMKFRSKKSMEDWEQELDQRLFFRCHKGYIVNFRFIEESDEYILLDNGERVPISRRKKKDFNNKIREYDLYYSE